MYLAHTTDPEKCFHIYFIPKIIRVHVLIDIITASMYEMEHGCLPKIRVLIFMQRNLRSENNILLDKIAYNASLPHHFQSFRYIKII